MAARRNRRCIIRWRQGVLFALLILFVALAAVRAVRSLNVAQLTAEQDSYTITVSYGENARIPDGASLAVAEIPQNDDEYVLYRDKAANHLSVEKDKIANAHFFDISIMKDGAEIQPQAPVDVRIELSDSLSGDIKTVHFGEEIESLQPAVSNDVEDSSRNATISFEAKGFSVYGIIELPSEDINYTHGWHRVTSLDQFDAIIANNIGIYVSHRSGYYFTDQVSDINGDGSRYGIVKTKPKTTSPDTAISQGAVPYYFEKSNDKYYAYFFNSSREKRYIQQSGNSLYIVTSQSDATAFDILPSATYSQSFVLVGSDQFCWNMRGGEAGSAFAAYQGATDNNAMMKFEYQISQYDEIVELAGQSFAIVRYNKNVTSNYYGAALTAANHSTNSNNLAAKKVEGKIEHLNFVEDYFLIDGSSADMWDFEYSSDNHGGYYISSTTSGAKKYLSYVNNDSNSYSLVLVDAPDAHSQILINLGSGNHAGMFNMQFADSSLYIVLQDDNYQKGFKCVSGGPPESAWLYLAVPKNLSDDAFDIFSAKKVGVTEIQNGQDVVIYTRLWDEASKKYRFYAIDHDGSLVRVYDNGNDISYYSTTDNTPLWHFTEYYYEDGSPNYYYDFQNNHSGKYLAPQLTDNRMLADSPIGLIMNGRRYGDYYSQILAWDFAYYDYAGPAISDSNRLSPVRMSLADDFYFAVVSEPVSGLTEAETVDNSLFGVTMRLIDYNNEKNSNGRDAFQMEVMGGAESDKYRPNLLYRNLGTDGYPVATLTNRSLSELFADATTVNHLLTKNTYEESGYFEFDSTQSYAYLEDGTNFKVYNQIGTYQPKTNPSNSLKHGQFYPYNDLQEGYFANFRNTYDIHSNELSDRNPRKNELLYAVSSEDIDFHFGMEVEATFMQSVDGKDYWGHDIAFDFSGDDDMWLFVDGILVVDLGGVHGALDGSVNFATGAVVNNGNHTNLREVFRLSYLEKNPSATEAEITEWLDSIFKDGGTVFKNYTSHTMKMFFMERGGNASNLHMRFNLSPVVMGRVELEKQLTGTDKQDYASGAFPFQIFRKSPGESAFTQVSAADGIVFYKESGQFVDSTNLSGYGDVFLLKPGQHAYIYLQSDEVEYYVRECAVNTQIYDGAIANGHTLTQIPSGEDRADYEIEAATVSERRLTTFTNHVDPAALRTLTMQKRLFANDETTELQSADPSNMNTFDDTTFDFRYHLGDELGHYRLGKYYVKDPQGNYCTYDNETQRFVSTGVSSLDNLSEEQQQLATFTTSPSGAVSNIPAQYSVEVRNLLPEMKFKIEERDSEVPDGYKRMGYERINGSYIIEDADSPNIGIVKYDQDASIDVKNKVGWTVKIQKVWSDDSFMSAHDAIYFAVFAGTDNAPIVIRQMTNAERALRFYFDSINGNFSDYYVREVALTNPVVDGDGQVVSYGAMTVINNSGNNIITVDGIYKGDSASKPFRYSASYDDGEVQGRWGNIISSKATNSRVDGINLYKTDRNGTPLGNAVFSITDNRGNQIGDETYTSDANGFIGTVYLKENTTYLIREIAAPEGYITIPTEISVASNATGDGIALNGTGQETVAAVSTTTNANDTLTIINNRFHLPATGGAGTAQIYGVAAALIASPIFYLSCHYVRKRKRRRAMARE